MIFIPTHIQHSIIQNQPAMFQIIEANSSHLEPLVDLFDAYRVWYRKASDKKTARQFLEDRIQQKESIIYLVEDSTKKAFCGFVQLYPLFSSTRMRRLWLLNDLFVSPNYRGNGLSKLLIDRAKELAIQTNAAGLLLETEKTNTIGNQLYPSAHFELADATNYYFWTNTESN